MIYVFSTGSARPENPHKDIQNVTEHQSPFKTISTEQANLVSMQIIERK